MPLSKRQLQQIEEAIRKRFLGITYEALGEKALTAEEIKELQSYGLLRRGTRHMVADPYLLGKAIGLVERNVSSKLTLDELSKLVQSGAIVPITPIETKAIEFASEHAGEYIKGLMSTMTKGLRTSVSKASGETFRRIREDVSESIAKRQTASELRTELFNNIDERYRDWQRIAHTEINTATQNGIYERIKEKSPKGHNQLVFKRPAPDACKHCKRLYLKPDGITPKIFRLKDLEYSNIGRKVAEWRPVIGSTHPWCHCQLSPLLDGYDFIIKNVDADSGEEIPEHLLSTYDGRTEKIAVLSYIGE